MGALRAFPGVCEEESPLYDVTPTRGHITMIHDAVLDQIGEQLGSSALAVYVVLERRAGKTGTCDPSYDTIAMAVKRSRRHVIEQIKALKDAGHIKVDRRKNAQTGNDSNLFTLPNHPSVIAFDPSENIAPPPSEIPANNDQNPSENIAPPSEHPSEIFAPKVVTSINQDILFGDPPEQTEPKKPLPLNGPAQKIVAWWCQRVGVDEPADYKKAVGQAQQLHKRGITTAGQADDLYAYCIERLEGGITLGGMVACLDGWKASKARPAVAKKSTYDPWTTPDL